MPHLVHISDKTSTSVVTLNERAVPAGTPVRCRQRTDRGSSGVWTEAHCCWLAVAHEEMDMIPVKQQAEYALFTL